MMPKIYSHKTKFKPKNHYGKSKLQPEKYIIKSGCAYTILRFGGIYGEKGPSHLGINNFIRNAIKVKDKNSQEIQRAKKLYLCERCCENNKKMYR